MMKKEEEAGGRRVRNQEQWRQQQVMAGGMAPWRKEKRFHEKFLGTSPQKAFSPKSLISMEARHYSTPKGWEGFSLSSWNNGGSGLTFFSLKSTCKKKEKEWWIFLLSFFIFSSNHVEIPWNWSHEGGWSSSEVAVWNQATKLDKTLDHHHTSYHHLITKELHNNDRCEP